MCFSSLSQVLSLLLTLSLSCYVSFSAAAAAAWPGLRLTLLAVRQRVFVSFLVCAARRQSGYILSVFKELFCFKFFTIRFYHSHTCTCICVHIFRSRRSTKLHVVRRYTLTISREFPRVYWQRSFRSFIHRTILNCLLLCLR